MIKVPQHHAILKDLKEQFQIVAFITSRSIRRRVGKLNFRGDCVSGNSVPNLTSTALQHLFLGVWNILKDNYYMDS